MQNQPAKRTPVATLALIGIALGYQVWPVQDPQQQSGRAQAAVQKVAAVMEGSGATHHTNRASQTQPDPSMQQPQQ